MPSLPRAVAKGPINDFPETFPVIIKAKDNSVKSLEGVKAKIKPLLKKPVRVLNSRKNFRNEIIINTSSLDDPETMKEAVTQSKILISFKIV